MLGSLLGGYKEMMGLLTGFLLANGFWIAALWVGGYVPFPEELVVAMALAPLCMSLLWIFATIRKSIK